MKHKFTSLGRVFPDGGGGLVLSSCDTCGAVVAESAQALHSEWHSRDNKPGDRELELTL